MHVYGIFLACYCLLITDAVGRIDVELDGAEELSPSSDDFRNEQQDNDGACISNPCLNNGLCVSSAGGFVCICIDGHLGMYCERRADECPMDVAVDTGCQNGGLCKLDRNGVPVCHCMTGYDGDRCQSTIDYCQDSPCLNSASCKTKGKSYQCACPDGHSGTNCQIDNMELEACLNHCRSSEKATRCWRDRPTTATVEWGYGDLTCNSLDSCFGARIPVENQTSLGYIDVQLRPIQIQPGDTLVFTLTDKSEFLMETFVPFLLSSNVEESFLECNFTGAKPLASNVSGVSLEGSKYIIDSSVLLQKGNNYFAANLNMFVQCKFGFRLNVTLKEHSCRDPVTSRDSQLCNGRGRCETTYLDQDYQCHCCLGYSGKYCEYEDPCFINPCLNGGVCRDYGNEGIYTCHCTAGYEGRRCEAVVNHCRDSPCQNEGQCTSLLTGYQCQCTPGHTGSACETVIDHCVSQPCRNGATCLRQANSFSCQCRQGFQGALCEINIDECASNPCRHGACVDGIGTYHCHCQAAFTGALCESHLRLCGANPCVNGKCIDTDGGFECSCGMAFVGRLCEIKLDLCALEEFCITKHALACVDKGNNVTCVCQDGYEGPNCGVDTDNCARAQCPGQSYCVDKVAGYDCICKDGYVGVNCDVSSDDDVIRQPANHETSNELLSRSHQMSRDFKPFELIFGSTNCYKLQQQNSIHSLQLLISSCIRQACQCQHTPSDVRFDLNSVGCYDARSGRFDAKIALQEGTELKALLCEVYSCMESNADTKLGFASLRISSEQKGKACGITYSSSDDQNSTPRQDSSGLGIGGIIAIATSLFVAILCSISVTVFCWKRRASTRVENKREKSLPPPSNKRMVAFVEDFDNIQAKRACRTTKVKKIPQSSLGQGRKLKSENASGRRVGSEAR